MRSYAFLGVAIILNTTSYVLYKYASLNATKTLLSAALFLSGLLIGAVNAFFYTKSLQRISLNTAYPTFSATTILLVALLSALVFGEAVTPRKIAGIAVIILGVVLVSS